MSRIGIVAGHGELPVTFARNAKAKGEYVVGFGIRGLTSDALERHVDKMHWLAWGALQKAVMLAVFDRATRIVLLGKIEKSLVLKDDAGVDDEMKKTFAGAGGKKDYSILKGVEGILRKVGISIIDPTPYLEELVPRPGTVTRRALTAQESADIAYGREVARSMAGFDVGQTVAVKDRTVVAVEAIEGTDEAIRRAGSLVQNGFVVVKMARPEQDMRFDVPIVGLETVKALAAAKGTALALEAGKMYLCDREELIRYADDHTISIVAL